MLSITSQGGRLCDGWNRREVLRAGGLGVFGLTLPELLRMRSTASAKPANPSGGRARSCIILFLMGGPPQHSTWDPKPDQPAEVRGDFKPIATAVPGIQISELMPRLARVTNKLAILRAVSTNDNAHSSSGYYMLTGQPHQPMNRENANPGPPNDAPFLGAVVQRLRGAREALPASVRLPMRIFNTDGSVWPGQDSGFLGRTADPWLLRCEPGSPNYRIPEFTLSADVPAARLTDRQTLLTKVSERFDTVERSGVLARYNRTTQQAFDLLASAQARSAFDLSKEPVAVRDRYGRTQFGQSVLLARRLIEAGVSLVHVNWFRGPEEPSDAPCWDSHAREPARLKNVLVPPTDQAFSALIEDLAQRGRLDETLIVCMAEFGRTPKLNKGAGRDHWGPVFSIALAGGGVRGGVVHGRSDRMGGYPSEGRVGPEDVAATIFHCLGYRPETEIHDSLGRPIAITRGRVIDRILA
jgi:Protein of unknown function (DUF1501)